MANTDRFPKRWKWTPNRLDEPDLAKRMHESFLESEYIDWLRKDPKRNYMLPWFDVLQIVSVEKLSATTARAVFRFPVQREYLNPMMGLHGGLSAALYDTATTWTLDPIRKPGFWNFFGTTRSLNLTFMNPAAEGDWLRMECEVIHAGKRLCLIRATLTREKDGAIVSTCEHQKFNVDPEVAKV